MKKTHILNNFTDFQWWLDPQKHKMLENRNVNRRKSSATKSAKKSMEQKQIYTILQHTPFFDEWSLRLSDSETT